MKKKMNRRDFIKIDGIGLGGLAMVNPISSPNYSFLFYAWIMG